MLFDFVVRLVFLASSFQLPKITRDLNQEFVRALDYIEIGHLCVIQYIRLDPITQRCLTLQQFSVLFVGLCLDVDLGQRKLRDWHHVIESQKSVSSAVQFDDVLTCFDICVIWLW